MIAQFTPTVEIAILEGTATNEGNAEIEPESLRAETETRERLKKFKALHSLSFISSKR